MRLKALAFLLLSGLSACATAPVPTAKSHSVPAERLLSGYVKYASPSSATERVTIIRDSGILGAAAPAKLSVDGTDVAKIRTSERLELHLQPGSHIFGAEPSPRLGGALVEESFELKLGEPRYFRISVGSGVFVIQPSTQIN